MAEKKLDNAVRKPAIATSCGDETTMLLDQPVENNIHTGEQVDMAGNSSTTPSTSVDYKAATHARGESNLEHTEYTISYAETRRSLESEPFPLTTYSPYACSPVAIDCGPGLATFWVPKYLLRSPRWSTTDAGGTLCLPGVSAATGHTLVHYLYTGTYQTLEANVEDAVAPAHIKLKQALLTFILASACEIQDLERLAKEQIEIYGGRMGFVQILGTVKEEFSKMTSCWFHEYLQARADDQFDLDFTVFTSKVFIQSLGEGTLHSFMTSHLLKRFSEELAHTLHKREAGCLDKEKPDAVLDDIEHAAIQTHHCLCDREHQPGICTASDEMSFEFPNEPYQEVYDVISLESSVCDEIPPAHPEPEPVPPAEPEPEPEPEPERVVLEPEPEPEPAIDPFAGLSKFQKKKLQDKMKKEAKMKEEKDAKRKEEEEAAEKIRQAEEAEAERVAREAEEAAAAEQQRIAAEEAEAEAAQITAEEEAARIAEEEAARKKQEEEEEEERASKSTEWAASIWGSSKKKESTKDRKAREKREKEQEEKERLAREEIDRLAAEEQARIEAEAAERAWIAEEEAEAARLAAEEEERKKKEKEEEASKGIGWGHFGFKKKETSKQKREREAKEKKAREEERLAQEAKEAAKAAEQAQIEAGEAKAARIAAEEAEAARIAAEDALLLAPVSSKGKKKKKKRGIVEEKPPKPPTPLPTPEDLDADLFDFVKDIPEDQLLAELGEDLKTEPISEISSTLCPWLSHHILDVNRWRSCKRCYIMLRGIADQMVEEKRPVLLPG